jgi:hypothetical protein
VDKRGYSDLVCTMLLLLVSLFGLEAGATDKTEIKGFYGIPWGANLAERNELRLVEETEHVESYELKDGSPLLGEAKLSMMRFVATDGQFARVAIRYSGEKNHAHILTYLQSIFGPIERSPGSMMRGLNQQFTWRSEETEVNLTYQSFQDRGSVFIESRTLAPRFNDVLPEGAY